jgi:hypothetical protein
VIKVELAKHEIRTRDKKRRRIFLGFGRTIGVHLTVEEAAYVRDRLTRITKEAIRAIKKT